jgi:fructose-1,6-bisphosphatase/sedoheptulose 1,7-bisphosphatase-like protein
MDELEKTVKIRAYSDNSVDFDAQLDDHRREQEMSYELASKTAQLAEEKNKSLEHLKTIVQLRESHKREQAKVAEMANKVSELEEKIRALSRLETSELTLKSTLLEKEKNKSLEQLKTIEQQKESLDRALAKAAEMEARVRDLSEMLGKISSIAAAAKAG